METKSTCQRAVAAAALKAGLLASVAIAANAWGGGALAAAPGVQAQPAAAAELDAIIVTARKRGEDLQTTPVAVSAFTSESLERQNIGRIDELSSLAPSLTISEMPSYTGVASVYLRGIGTPNLSLSEDSPISIYFDGVPLTHNVGSLLGVTDLERVEVLRGPQGTLNGRNSTGGSVSLFSRRPSETFGIEQKLSYGTYNDFISRTTVDFGKIGDTGLSARLTYKYQSRGGVVNNTLVSRGKDPGAINANAVFFALHGDFANDIEVDYRFDYDSSDNVALNTQIVSATPLVVNYFGPSASRGGAPFNVEGTPLGPNLVSVSPKRLDDIPIKYWGSSPSTMQGHSFTVNLPLTDELKLKSITGRRKSDQTTASIIGSYGQLRAPAGLNTVGTTVRDVDISVIPATTYNQSQWSQEVQLNGDFESVQFVAGVFWFEEKYRQFYEFPGSITTRPVTATSGIYTFGSSFLDYRGKSESQAAFAQVSYSPPMFDGKLEVTGGARYTEDARTFIQSQPANLVRRLKLKFDNLSGEFSVKYRWTPDVMTYFRVAQAYKAGGVNPRDTSSFAGYGPEKIISYEAGVKAELFDRRVRVNADVFHSNYKDLQVGQSFTNTPATPCPLSTCSRVVNAGRAVYNGVEVEAVVLPARGWRISGGFGYVDPEYKEFFLTPTLDIADLPGAQFSGVSELTANATVQYDFEPMSFGELSASLSWDYHSKRYFTIYAGNSPNNEFIKDPGFHNISAQVVLSNIRLESVPGEYELKVFAKNLRDKYPVVRGTELTTFGSVGFGLGRTFGIGLTGRYY